MKMNIKNIYEPRSKRVKKIMLALKAFIGSIATANYIQQREDIAFWLLFGGALIDFLSEFIDDESNNHNNTP